MQAVFFDRVSLHDCYDGMRAMVAMKDYLDRLSDPTTGLLLQGARGDWIPPGELTALDTIS